MPHAKVAAAVVVALLAAATAPAQTPAAVPRFDYHSGFWLNLHHVLYHEAGRKDPVPTAGLTDEQTRAWTAAVAAYREKFVKRDLLFDQEMIDVKDRLGDLEAAASLRDSGLPADLVAALEQAAPVYRARWWAEHDRANRAWIEHVTKLVERHGAALAADLAVAYATPWPAEPVRVDVVQHANWAGAYTTLDPTRVTVASNVPANHDEAALEILFHETSHALVRTIHEAITREAARQKKQLPRRDLWHAVLFYTTGELARRRLPGPYVPYAVKHGLYESAWKGHLPLLEREWRPYVDRKIDLQTAVARLVAAL